MSAAALEWSFNPWRDRPLAAGAGALMTLGICLVVASLSEPLAVRVVLGLAVLGTLSPVLSPARCRVDEEGVERRGPLGTVRRPWATLRRAATRPAGVLVSPYARPHWLDPYRGLLLPLPSRDRDALLADLAARLHDHGL
jgi:hypothetical protein